MTATSPRTYRAAPRPAGVTLLVVLIVISGILSVVGGVWVIIVRHHEDVIRQTHSEPSTLLAYGVLAIIVGAIYLLVARGLAHASSFARFLVAVVAILNLAGGIYLAAVRHGQLGVNGIVGIVLSAIVLILLFTRRANDFFATP